MPLNDSSDLPKALGSDLQYHCVNRRMFVVNNKIKLC